MQFRGYEGGGGGMDPTTTVTFGSTPHPVACGARRGRDAFQGKGLQKGLQKRPGRRLEVVAKAAEGGYCRLKGAMEAAGCNQEESGRGTGRGPWRGPSNAGLHRGGGGVQGGC